MLNYVVLVPVKLGCFQIICTTSFKIPPPKICCCYMYTYYAPVLCIISDLQVTGDATEEQLLTSVQMYRDRSSLLRYALNKLFIELEAKRINISNNQLVQVGLSIFFFFWGGGGGCRCRELIKLSI